MKKTSNLLFLKSVALLSLSVLLTSCKSSSEDVQSMLPSWTDGTKKEAIISFVEDVTNPQSKNYVAVEDRIAVFDNDGTLISERPLSTGLYFGMDRLKAMAKINPELRQRDSYEAVLNNDLAYFREFAVHGAVELAMATHTDMTPEEFDMIVDDWLEKAKHPKTNKKFTDMVYQPMLELIHYLKNNDFKIFIVTGGETDFVRAYSEMAYGIPKHHVIGSGIKTKIIYEDSEPVILRLPEVEYFNDETSKPMSINKFIGRRPIFCVGNSDADLGMLRYTASNEQKSFSMVIHHTDSEREWKYDKEVKIGHLEKLLVEAEKQKWAVVDMKNDWQTVYK